VSNPDWVDVSVEAKDFISKCLVVDPKDRWTTDQLLQHAWLELEASDEHRTKALDTLKGLKAKQRLRAAVKTIMAVNRFESFMRAGQTEE